MTRTSRTDKDINIVHMIGERRTDYAKAKSSTNDHSHFWTLPVFYCSKFKASGTALRTREKHRLPNEMQSSHSFDRPHN